MPTLCSDHDREYLTETLKKRNFPVISNLADYIFDSMGAYLSEPILDKHSSDEISACLSYGASSMQGWRVNQEVRTDVFI